MTNVYQQPCTYLKANEFSLSIRREIFLVGLSFRASKGRLCLGEEEGEEEEGEEEEEDWAPEADERKKRGQSTVSKDRVREEGFLCSFFRSGRFW